jgi:exopolysaccharide production protein ExoQ
MLQAITNIGVAFGVLGLFLLNRDPRSRTSKALWIPVAWLLIIGSRSVTQWLQIAPATSADSSLEGSPIDAFVYASLLILGLIVLVRRGRAVTSILRANGPILLYFSYSALSIFWSDYPDIAFKRWVKAVSDIVMVLIVLTDPDRLTAVKRLIARVGFLLLPFSILFDLFRQHSVWNGTPHWRGVTTHKNLLGVDCLVFGLGSLWCFIESYSTREDSRRIGPLVAHGAVVLLAILLAWEADSMTSVACLLVASVVMVLTMRARRPVFVHALVAGLLSVVFSTLFLHIGTDFVQDMGRDSTLTGRTELWGRLLGMVVNPTFGAGFESFWLGDRLKTLWNIYPWNPNEAHNGYLEVFLNLGWIGLVLLAFILVKGYRDIVGEVHRHVQASNLRLAYLVAALAYSFTEAGFRELFPLWIALSLAVTVIPVTSDPRAPAHTGRESTNSPSAESQRSTRALSVVSVRRSF